MATNNILLTPTHSPITLNPREARTRSWTKVGREAGLQGKDLLEFVRTSMTDEDNADREERRLRREECAAIAAAEREEIARREKAAAERDERERKEKESQLQREHEIKLKELELQANQETEVKLASSSESVNRVGKAPHIRLKDFDESRDDLDDYLRQFERIASSQQWDQDVWALQLGSLLKGKARQLYNSLNDDDASDYDVLKHALLTKFRLTAEGYRSKLRNVKLAEGETFNQLVSRMFTYLYRWIELSGKTKTFSDLSELIVLEQLLNTLSPDVVIFIKERQPDSVEEAASLAQVYREAHSSTKSYRPPRLPKDNKGDNKPHSGKTGTSSSPVDRFPVRRCYQCNQTGHLKRDCPKGKDRGSVRAVITPKGTQVTVDKPSDVMPSDTVNTENNSTSSVLCPSCASKDFSPECAVVVNGFDCKGLRDTGASTFVVRSSLVPPVAYTGEKMSVTLAETSVMKDLPMALVDVKTPQFSGKVKAIVFEKPPCDLIIGNYAYLPDGKEVPISVYPVVDLFAVQTRAQAEKERLGPKPLPTPKVTLGDISPKELRRLQLEDPSLSSRRKLADSGNAQKCSKTGSVRFFWKNNILHRSYQTTDEEFKQVVVPTKLRTGLMALAHESILGGHMAAKKTLNRVWLQFYWPGITSDIRRYCASCDVCQRMTPKGKTPKAPLEKMPLIDEPFKRVAVDIVGPIIPAADSGARFILTMVDYATRYPEAKALKRIDSISVAEALNEFWSRVGIPKEMLTDNGAQFTGDLMKEVNRLLSVNHLVTTPYHAQCNGLVERYNGTLKAMLKKLCADEPKCWDRYIPALLFAYREVPNDSLKFSPFELLYGRRVRGPMDILQQVWTNDTPPEEVKNTAAYVVDLRNRIHDMIMLAQKNLKSASEHYATHFDKKARKRNFKAGDKVLLLLPLKSNKLQLQWRGPFEVLQKVGACDYRICVNNKTRLYHINLLRKYIERPVATSAETVATVVIEESEVDDSQMELPLCTASEPGTVKDVHYGPDLPPAMKAVAQRLILREGSSNLTDSPLLTPLQEFHFQLTTAEPIRVKQYPLPHAKVQVVKEEVQKMLQLGVIEPASSPYNSPIVLVGKKDGTTRFCIDFRKLNAITVFDAEPMPDVDHLYSELSKARYFSKFDLTKGYWQIPVKREDRDKTAFSTPAGQFRWVTMPFGLVNAGACFTKMMRKLLEPLQCTEFHNFIDDVLLATESWERHLECIQMFLRRLKEANLAAKPSKCFIGYRKVEFLGHMVGNGIMQPTDDKVTKIKSAEQPKTKTEVRSFIGLASYYRRYMPNFAAIALPLTDLTKKKQPTQVVWTPECEEAFRTLKDRLSSFPVVRLVDLDKEFVLRTDASNHGLGAVLLQETDTQLHPVCYISRKLNQAERNYATVEKECLAIVWAVKKFAKYLYGRPFIVESDHQPLQYLQQSKSTNGRLMRWSLVLQPYRFIIRVIPGKDNVGADFMSRRQ